jgi:hypothetical protein
MDSTLESRTPSVNTPLKVVVSWMVFKKKDIHNERIINGQQNFRHLCMEKIYENSQP